MGARTRNLDSRTGVTGTYTNYTPSTVIVSRTGASGLQETCDDVTGNFPNPNPFRLDKTYVHVPTMNGVLRSAQTGAVLREFNNFPMWNSPAAPNPSNYYPDLDEVDRSNLGWELLATTNVSAPHVSVPTFIYELRDIPEAVREWGKSRIRDAARGYLSWRWIVKPMISDLRKLYNFTQAVERRRVQLFNLQTNRSLRSAAGLSQQSMTIGPTAVTLHSEGATINGWRTYTITERIWGSVQWKLKSDYKLPPAGYYLQDFARRLTWGYTSQEALALLWESMPWSWFVDWFAGIGDIIAATNNAVPMTWSNICLMHYRRADATYTIRPTGTATWPVLSSMPYQFREYKSRHVMSTPILPAKISLRPLFSGSHWSILASLATLRSHDRVRLVR